MVNEDIYDVDYCLECHCKIHEGEKIIQIEFDKYDHRFIHDNQCWNDYRKLLYDQDEIDKGCIVGVCEFCVKPVRNGHEFYVGRMGKQGEVDTDESFHSTFPGMHNGHKITFAHKKCEDDFNKEVENDE